MKVPAKFRRAVENVIAEYDAIDARIERGKPRGFANAAHRAMKALIEELGLDRAAHPREVLASELTDDQHAVLVALTARPIPIESVAEIPPWWPRRRWLGLAPPGTVERRWAGTWPDDVDAAIDKLPAKERVEAGVEALLARRAFAERFFASLERDAPLALGYARTTLPLLPLYDRDPKIAVALFTAFSSSGETVPEGADERFPLAYRLPGEPLSKGTSTRFLVPHLEAIAESRRDAVLEATIRRTKNAGTYQAAMHILEQSGPLPRATKSVRRYLESAKKVRMTGGEKKALADLARRLEALDHSP